jgi:hypothetical protein
MKEDVKKKSFSAPPREDAGVVTYIQPHVILRGVVGLAALDWPLWIAAHFSDDANPSCLSQLDGSMKQWRSTPFGSEATQAKRWPQCVTIARRQSQTL